MTAALVASSVGITVFAAGTQNSFAFPTSQSGVEPELLINPGTWKKTHNGWALSLPGE